MEYLADENGEFKSSTVGADDKKAWWKKGYEKLKKLFIQRNKWNHVGS
jgi:hypothetical protein